jgi:hypothetical protein
MPCITGDRPTRGPLGCHCTQLFSRSPLGLKPPGEQRLNTPQAGGAPGEQPALPAALFMFTVPHLLTACPQHCAACFWIQSRHAHAPLLGLTVSLERRTQRRECGILFCIQDKLTSESMYGSFSWYVPDPPSRSHLNVDLAAFLLP